MEMVNQVSKDSPSKADVSLAAAASKTNTPLVDTGSAEIEEKMEEEQCSCQYNVYHREEIEEKDMTSSIACTSFSERVGLIGFTQLKESAGSLKKTFWSAITVISLACLIGHTTLLISRFARFDTNIELEVITQKTLEFPAVTVCNNNMIKIPPSINGSQFIGRGIRDVGSFIDYLHFNDSSLGHQKQDFILWASFDNQNLSTNDFNLVMNAFYGNCFTFNIKNSRRTRRALPGYGLQMILNVETYSYDNLKSHIPPSWKGAIVNVHAHNTEAIVEEGGVSVGVNSLASIALKRTVFTRQNGLYGDCLGETDEQPKTYYRGKYTKEHCDNTCLQREVINQCCCYIKTISRNLRDFGDSWENCRKRDIRACIERSSQSNETDCWQKVWDSYDRGELKCNQCVPQCRETSYDTSAASVSWPSAEYMSSVLEKELNSRERLLDQLTDYNVTTNRTITEDFVKQNLLMVQIYYGSMTTTYVNEVAAVGIAEFASELSSAIGFWVGWSVWTLFQFCEFLSDVIVIAIRSRQKTKNRKDLTKIEQ